MQKKIINEINKLIENNKNIVITIDGMAASGKTTLANYLKERFSARLIHADDFFLPVSKKTKERLNTPGGNIDYEKMKEDVIEHLKEDIKYLKYDCNSNSFNQLVELKNNQVTIIEGSYSLHPYFGKYYDLAIFLQIDSELQKERILKRNGEFLLAKFKNEWIPMENKYFSFYKIKEKADFIINYR